MKTIILLGELGRQFGRRHRLDVASAAEAVRALCANFADFARVLSSSRERGVGYRVLADRAPAIDLGQLHHPVSQTIHIVPVISGAGGGVGQILLGAAIIGAAFMTGGASLSATGALVTTAAGQIAVGIGVSLALGGIIQMLSPAPKAQTPTERPENKPSYIFDGPVNTTAQGHPVPVGYGRMIVGSSVISAGLYAEELPITGVDPVSIIGALGKS